MNAETRIQELRLELPPAPKPVAVYKPLVVAGNLAYVSGHGPLRPDKSPDKSGRAVRRQSGGWIVAPTWASAVSMSPVPHHSAASPPTNRTM